MQLVEGRAAAAQEYTVEIRDAILDGLQIEFLRRVEEALSVLPAPAFSEVGVMYGVAGNDAHVDPMPGDFGVDIESSFVAIDGTYIDVITGGHLEAELVQEGPL